MDGDGEIMMICVHGYDLANQTTRRIVVVLHELVGARTSRTPSSGARCS